MIAGVAAGLRERGLATGGFKAYAYSDVPGGAGLSSSAAFEALVGEIESGLYNGGAIDEVENAKIGQFAENVYFVGEGACHVLSIRPLGATQVL